MRAKSNASRRYSNKPDENLPELTTAMLKRGSFKRGSKPLALSAGTAEFKRAVGRPKFENPKQLLTLRLSPDVIELWRATGPGWQSRLAKRLARVA